MNGASTPQLIGGRYAMIVTGRYVNMDLRRFKTPPVALSFSQFLEYDFKNLTFISRNTAIYKGSKHKEYAKIFLLFLASREYNELLIRSSDGLPPNPRWAENNPEYLAPPAANRGEPPSERAEMGPYHRPAGQSESLLSSGGRQGPVRL